MGYPRSMLRPGDPAPDFSVAAVQSEEIVSLGRFRGRCPLLLALFRGVFCPFCRRAIVQMASSAERLRPFGIESVAIVATELENARLYYRFRPTKLMVAADPNHDTHRSYGVPRIEPTPALMAELAEVRINPTGELPFPMPIDEAGRALNAMEGYEPTETDRRESAVHFTQLAAQFLIDRDGIVRWINLEGEPGGPAHLGRFPAFDELLAAASAAHCVSGHSRV